MSVDQYYVRWRGELTGPFELDQLQEMAAQGRISKLHDVSTDQMDWHRAGTWAEVFPPHGLSAKPLPEPTAAPRPAASAEPMAGAPVAEPEARPEPGQWYCSREGEVEGPYDSDHIANLVAEGELGAESYLNAGADASGWRLVREVEQFAAFLPPERRGAGEGALSAALAQDDYPYAEPVAAYLAEDYSSTARASMVLGLVGVLVPLCGIVALVLARRAFSGSPAGDPDVEPMARAGLVLGCVDIGLDVLRLGVVIALVMPHIP